MPFSAAQPGREARRDNEYERCGTANVFCAVEPRAGRHFTFPTSDRSGFEFAQALCHLALAYPEAKTIHLVMDNLNIHRKKPLTDLYGAEFGGEIWDRFTVHYTPTHGSWRNQAEIEIGIFSRQCLGTRRIPDLETLRREPRAWNRRMNRDRITINWKFDRRAARRKFGYKGNLSRGQRPSRLVWRPWVCRRRYGRVYRFLSQECSRRSTDRPVMQARPPHPLVAAADGERTSCAFARRVWFD